MGEADREEDIEKLAIEVFGNAEKAMKWLRKPMRRFEGKSPLEAAKEECNAQIIRTLLYSLDNGYLG